MQSGVLMPSGDRLHARFLSNLGPLTTLQTTCVARPLQHGGGGDVPAVSSGELPAGSIHWHSFLPWGTGMHAQGRCLPAGITVLLSSQGGLPGPARHGNPGRDESPPLRQCSLARRCCSKVQALPRRVTLLGRTLGTRDDRSDREGYVRGVLDCACSTCLATTVLVPCGHRLDRARP